MKQNIISAQEIAHAMQGLDTGALALLSTRSGVTITTLRNIQRGATPNPGIETVRKFWPHMVKPKKVKVRK